MINLCVYGVPLPPYIKEWRRGGPALSMARPLLAGRTSPLLLYIGGAGGHPRDTTIDRLIF